METSGAGAAIAAEARDAAPISAQMKAILGVRFTAAFWKSRPRGRLAMQADLWQGLQIESVTAAKTLASQHTQIF
jgi:hypothetical protein